jgi:hypothetical protein
MAERVRESNSKSRIAFQATAEGGERFALVLEFEFLSRIIASMQSMSSCRHSRRPLRVSSKPYVHANHSAPSTSVISVSGAPTRK